MNDCDFLSKKNAEGQASGSEWITQSGGLFSFDECYGPQVFFLTPISLEQVSTGCLIPLTDISLLNCTGPDSLEFFQGQTTNDIKKQEINSANWHGYCLPSGRLLATFLSWKNFQSEVWSLVSASVSQNFLQRLSKFILRSKVKIIENKEYVVLGVVGVSVAEVLSAVGLPTPDVMSVDCSNLIKNAENSNSGQSTNPSLSDGILVVGLSSVQVIQDLSGQDSVLSTSTVVQTLEIPRYIIMVPKLLINDTWSKLAALLPLAPTSVWRFLEIWSKFPRIVAKTEGRFLPQALEFDHFGGVNFRKGCYPGQEVIARSHYLGKVKRTILIGQLNCTDCQPGSEVFDFNGVSVGTVVSSAQRPASALQENCGISLDFLAEVSKEILCDKNPEKEALQSNQSAFFIGTKKVTWY